jgi:Protein of unknown function (DUF4235)
MAKKKKKKKKSGASSGGLAVTLAATGAALVVRKALAAGWTRVRGKEPPIDLTDPKVTLAEALGWAALVGVTVEMARFFIIRAVAKRALPEAGDAE